MCEKEFSRRPFQKKPEQISAMCLNLCGAACVFPLQFISLLKLCEMHPAAVSHPKTKVVIIAHIPFKPALYLFLHVKAPLKLFPAPLASRQEPLSGADTGLCAQAALLSLGPLGRFLCCWFSAAARSCPFPSHFCHHRSITAFCPLSPDLALPGEPAASLLPHHCRVLPSRDMEE